MLVSFYVLFDVPSYLVFTLFILFSNLFSLGMNIFAFMLYYTVACSCLSSSVHIKGEIVNDFRLVVHYTKKYVSMVDCIILYSCILIS